MWRDKMCLEETLRSSASFCKCLWQLFDVVRIGNVVFYHRFPNWRKCMSMWEKLRIRGEKKDYSLNILGTGEEGFVKLISEVSRRTHALLVSFVTCWCIIFLFYNSKLTELKRVWVFFFLLKRIRLLLIALK